MAIKKKAIRTKKEATELLASIDLHDIEVSWDHIPGVWIYNDGEAYGEQPTVVDIVTFSDLFTDQVFHQANQVLEVLNGERWPDHIPLDAYPTIERAIRTANSCYLHVASFHAQAAKEARDAEVLYPQMVDFTAIRLRNDDPNLGITAARQEARNKCVEYQNAERDAKAIRDQAKSVENALAKTIGTFMTILSKLKKDYEAHHHQG